MKRLILFLSFLVVIITLLFTHYSLYSQDWGSIRYVHSTTNIRAKRTTESKVVGQLEKGQKIKADFLKDNWYAVFPPKESARDIDESLGFVYAPLLKPTPVNKSSAKKSGGTLKYEIVDKEDISYQGTPRMVYRVVVQVNQKPSENELKKTAKQIWKKHGKGWEEFTVFIYLPGMDTNDAAYGAGEFKSYGLKEFRVQNFVLDFNKPNF